jgi:hypothetical protein
VRCYSEVPARGDHRPKALQEQQPVFDLTLAFLMNLTPQARFFKDMRRRRGRGGQRGDGVCVCKGRMFIITTVDDPTVVIR